MISFARTIEISFASPKEDLSEVDLYAYGIHAIGKANWLRIARGLPMLQPQESKDPVAEIIVLLRDYVTALKQRKDSRNGGEMDWQFWLRIQKAYESIPAKMRERVNSLFTGSTKTRVGIENDRYTQVQE